MVLLLQRALPKNYSVAPSSSVPPCELTIEGLFIAAV